MRLSANNINWFIAFRLPSAFICGVRVKMISESSCTVSVRESPINRNPFRSLYFAVQSMAGELSTGALVMQHIRKSGRNVSMLVASNTANYNKKATGRITFICSDGEFARKAIDQAIASGESQICIMESVGTNATGDIVSKMTFEWTIKTRPERR